MTGALCDAVLEEEGSAETLDSLARSNLFLVPLGADGHAYRYHHLFREMLRAELVRTEPEAVPDLLARAADWCEEHEEPEAALGYAQQAGDVARVARLFEYWAQPAYQRGRIATVERWLAWLEDRAALDQNAAVAVLGAFVAAVGGHPAQAERRADTAERASYRGRLPDGSGSIEAWKAVLNAALCRGGVARMRAESELAVRTLARSSQFRPTAVMALAVSHLLSGEANEADDLFADGVDEGLELGAVEAAAVSATERAAAATERDAWGEADALVSQATSVIRAARLEEYPSSAFTFAVAARVALRRREPNRAEELLAKAQRLRPRLTYALPWVAVQTRLELASAYLAMADAGGARTMMREIHALLRRRPDLGTLSARAADLESILKTARAKAPGASTLTSAELRVVPYLGTHLSFRQIGERRFISHHTVKSQAMAIYRKLSVSSRSEAVERGRALGLL
jgi:LuxR family transcriptional regulator, maltose regulon positive regulatory protein